jgi:pimeloyl-ACP methyl ester carboxylesterase
MDALAHTHDSIVLTLPAMTLNETEFPDFGVPTLNCSYPALLDCPEDSLARLAGMVPYIHGLEQWLSTLQPWQRAQRRVVVGHSFGALLALAWLTGRPRSRVDGFVAIAASPGPLFRRVRLGRSKHLRLPVAPILPLWNTRLVTRCVKWLLTGGRLTAEKVDFRALRARSDAAVDRAGWRNVEWPWLRAMRLALHDFDMRPSLYRIRPRTIVLHGDRDSLFEVDDARLLASEIPHAELRVIAGAGHALPITHPGAVVRAVHDLLGGLAPAKRKLRHDGSVAFRGPPRRKLCRAPQVH